MSAVADGLREARALVAKGWTQGAWARDASGEECKESDADAQCWCAGGAMFRASTGNSHLMFDAFKRGICEKGGPGKIFSWNDADSRTQAEVLAAFDKAIELAEAQS